MLQNKESIKLQSGLASFFRTRIEKTFYSTIGAAYIAYRIKEHCCENKFLNSMIGGAKLKDLYFDFLGDYDEPMVKGFLIELLDDCDTKAVEFALQFSKEVMMDFIVHAEDETSGKTCVGYSTPDSISALALEIMDIRSGESVIDNCSGVGSFLTSAFERQSDAIYMGVEINSWACGLAALRASVLDGNISIKQGNAFDYCFEMKADKAFSDFPLGLRVKSLEGTGVYERYKLEIPVLTKGTSADWLFNYRLLDLIKPSGRAVSIMSLGGLWNTLDREIRKYFLQQKRIEAIIVLPSHLLANTSVPVAMIVFGQGADNGIRFIDASNEYVEGRRQYILSAENIRHIMEAMHTDSQISRVVSYAEIAEQDFSFAIHRYLAKKETIKNAVEFSTLIKRIRRGIQLSASELDKAVSAVPTDIQYIVPANIQNGIIVKDIKCLEYMEQRFERYIVYNGNLLIAKNGYPFKIAVANVGQGKTLIASGNLFIIELDESRVNPFYVKAFLESEKGQAELKSILVGSVIPNIGANQLGTIQIPLIGLIKQNEIATQYLAAMDNVEYLRRKVEKAENELAAVISDLFGEDD